MSQEIARATQQNQEQRTTQRIQAYELRLEGLRYDEIDEYMQLAPGSAYRWCSAIRKAAQRDLGPSLLEMEVDRLDKLRARASADIKVLEDVMKLEHNQFGVIDPKTVESHGKALLVLLRIDESYRKLVGADADEKIKVEAKVSHENTTPQEEAIMEMIRKVQRENQRTMDDLRHE